MNEWHSHLVAGENEEDNRRQQQKFQVNPGMAFNLQSCGGSFLLVQEERFMEGDTTIPSWRKLRSRVRRALDWEG